MSKNKNKKEIEITMPSIEEARKRNQAIYEKIDFYIKDEEKNIGLNKKFLVHTFGCQGNVLDGEVIKGILLKLGFEETLEEEQADLIILNTCAIRENAENKIWGNIGRLKDLKVKNKEMILGICGCMPQEEVVVNQILEKYKHIDLVFGTHNIYRLPELLNKVYLNKKIVEVFSVEGKIVENLPKKRENPYKAFVNIMYGCNEFCSYCIVPYTRGQKRSRQKEDILAEIQELKDLGYKEVTLLGQNVNAYGTDLNNDYTFGDLLADISKIGIERIRFTTSHPRYIDDKTIESMKLYNVMPHLHLPVQSGSNDILHKMNRKYTKEMYLEKIKKLKEAVPGISITTDIIVGFPNETENDFLETIDLVEKVGYEGAFTFIYSRRSGTPSAKIEDFVSDEEKHNRLNRLNEKINEGYLKGNMRFENQIVKVLLDDYSKSNGLLKGYSEHNKLVHVECDPSLLGQIVNVKITKVNTWFMIGEICE